MIFNRNYIPELMLCGIFTFLNRFLIKRQNFMIVRKTIFDVACFCICMYCVTFIHYYVIFLRMLISEKKLCITKLTCIIEDINNLSKNVLIITWYLVSNLFYLNHWLHSWNFYCYSKTWHLNTVVFLKQRGFDLLNRFYASPKAHNK